MENSWFGVSPLIIALSFCVLMYTLNEYYEFACHVYTCCRVYALRY